ncbi:MAG TPA: hypothetical protein VFZ61_34970, partial [Polyangiales bacterium]
RLRGAGALAPVMRAAARRGRQLARSIFHGMLRYGPKLERKQAFLFRAVDVALELFALTATALRAQRERERHPNAETLALRACELSLERADAALHAMWHNHDDAKLALAREVLDERFAWLERGVMRLPYSAEELRPRSIDEYFAGRRRGARAEPVQPARFGAQS